MKIAVSTEGSSLTDNMDLRFGRAGGFIIYDTAVEEFEYLSNEANLNAVQGAGIQSAQSIVDKNVEVVITGYCGPKAYKVLEAAEIKIYTAEKDTVANVIEKFKNNALKEQEKDF